MKRLYFFAFLSALLGCADSFEYSPNQIHDSNSPRDLNEYNLKRLNASRPDDTLTIALTGDSQRFYDEVELFVDKINAINGIDLVLIAGDISDFGLLEEFEWMVERLDKLRAPYFGVIGNHDLVSNGEAVFERMFGPLNFSFVYDSVKFVLHNTNSREYLSPDVPDLPWLKEQLRQDPAVKHYIAVSHVPPFDLDFDPSLEDEYTSLFRSTPGFLLSLHGHIHKYSDGVPYDDGIRYITADAFDAREFILLKIVSGIVEREIIRY